ncbi:MAG: T9SS type A sorting domain-containing protein [Alphaproteobacteria bacterium]|nr:T9SS type A sorting domain-containing protein [Alphaproteobacteria bacterium]
MKTQILLFGFLCLFTWYAKSQDVQHNGVLQSGSEWIGTYINPKQSVCKHEHRMMKQNRNLLKPAPAIWKWDTIFCYNTSSELIPFQRVTRIYNSFGAALITLFERRQENFDWYNYARETFTYDSMGNELTYLAEKWENNAWVNSMNQEFAYNSNGEMVDWKRATWQSNAWENGWHYYYHFNSDGLNDTCIYQTGQDSLWINSNLWITSYDSNGYFSSIVTYTWINNGWEITKLATYTFDSNGNNLTRLDQNWENATWVNSYFYTYVWDTAGNRISTMGQEWENNAWVNDFRKSYTYDSIGNKITDLHQIWSGGSWINSSLKLYVYDTYNNNIEVLSQSWYNSVWENVYTTQFTYDSVGNSLTGRYLWWNSYVGAWQPDNGSLAVYADHQQDIVLQGVYQYRAMVDSVIVCIDPNRSTCSFSLFPNPAKSMVYVTSPPAPNNPCRTLTIYDLYGRLVLSKLIINETTGMDVSGLKPGVYFVRFGDDRKTGVVKFIKN